MHTLTVGKGKCSMRSVPRMRRRALTTWRMAVHRGDRSCASDLYGCATAAATSPAASTRRTSATSARCADLCKRPTSVRWACMRGSTIAATTMAIASPMMGHHLVTAAAMSNTSSIGPPPRARRDRTRRCGPCTSHAAPGAASALPRPESAPSVHTASPLPALRGLPLRLLPMVH